MSEAVTEPELSELEIDQQIERFAYATHLSRERHSAIQQLNEINSRLEVYQDEKWFVPEGHAIVVRNVAGTPLPELEKLAFGRWQKVSYSSSNEKLFSRAFIADMLYFDQGEVYAWDSKYGLRCRLSRDESYNVGVSSINELPSNAIKAREVKVPQY